MLIDSLAGPLTVRRRTVALRFGDAMGKPLFGGAVFGLATCGTLARDPQIDNLNHPEPRVCPQVSAPNVPIRWRVDAELGPYAVAVLIRENTVG
jgi:hypothetical protein